MTLFHKMRPLLLVCAMLMALAPLAAEAKTNSPAHVQAEIDNHNAQCGLLLSGVKVKGKLTASECAGSTIKSAEVRALSTLPSGAFLSEHARAEEANLEARCALVLAGQKVAGNLRADQCARFQKTAGTESRALTALPAASCPLAHGATLSRAQLDSINAYARSKAKADKKNLPEPAASPEVAALMACG